MKLRNYLNWIFFFAGIIAPIVFSDSYHRHLLILFALFATLALSLDIILGYSGQFTLGHSAFFGIGAYASALLAVHFNLSFWITLPLAGLFSGFIGFLIGFPSFRLKGPYFAIVTLCFSEIIYLIAMNWISLTKGPMGITKIPPPVIDIPFFSSFELNTELSYYYVVLGLMIFSIFITKKLINCRTGRAFLAIRENETLALSIGVNVYYFKIFAFGLGTMLAGMAGSAYAHYMRVITPEVFGWYYMGNAIVMVMVGGVGSISGAILGSFIFTILPESLRIVEDLRLILFGGILLLCIIYLPEGISRGLENFMFKIFKKSSDSR